MFSSVFRAFCVTTNSLWGFWLLDFLISRFSNKISLMDELRNEWTDPVLMWAAAASFYQTHSPTKGPQWMIISFIYFISFYILLWLHLPNTIFLLWIIRYLSVLCICVSIYYLGALRVYHLYVIVNYMCNLHM